MSSHIYASCSLCKIFLIITVTANTNDNEDTLTCAPSMFSSLPVFLSGDGEATIVDSGLANCDDDAGGDLELTSRRRDNGTELAVCRLTAESIKMLFFDIMNGNNKASRPHTEWVDNVEDWGRVTSAEQLCTGKNQMDPDNVRNVKLVPN